MRTLCIGKFSRISTPTLLPLLCCNSMILVVLAAAAEPQWIPLEFQCDQCEYQTNFRSYLVSHLRKHSEDRPYACDYPDCGKAYKWYDMG